MVESLTKVFDFIKATLNDENCVGSIRWECIRKEARVICRVCHDGEDGSNVEIQQRSEKLPLQILLLQMENTPMRMMVNSYKHHDLFGRH